MSMHSEPKQTTSTDDKHDKAVFLEELLNQPDVAGIERPADESATPEAAIQVETVLLNVWRHVFGENVSAEDNYFALGGDSLTSIRISARARRANINVTMQDIVEYPTLKELIGHLARREIPAAVDGGRSAPVPDVLGMAYPSTAAQEGMLFQCLAGPKDVLYVSQFSCVLVGPLQLKHFEEALRQLMRRHPALRVAFPTRMLTRHCQLIHDHVSLDFIFDAEPPLQGDAALDALARLEWARPFDLACPPLWRVRVARLDTDRHGWVWTQHHLVADGRAQECLLSELADLYGRLCDGKAVQAYKEELSYRDALIDAQASREQGKQFWTDYLAHLDVSPLLGHAASSARKAEAPTATAELTLEIASPEVELLLAKLAQLRLTVGSAFAAWFALALCATFERRDLLVGLVTSGRHGARAQYRDTVGNLITTVPLRATLNKGRSLRQWVRGMQQGIASLQRYEQTSLQLIKYWMDWPASNPLFDALFVHENHDSLQNLFETTTGLCIERPHFQVKEGCPLVLVCDSGSGVRLTLRYIPGLCPDDIAGTLFERIRLAYLAWLSEDAGDVLDVVNEMRARTQPWSP